MFITKKTHEQMLKLVTEQYEARISELHDEISRLSRLVFSPTTAEPLPVAREADAIITVSELSTKEPTDLERAAFEAELKEFNRILSGEYEISEDLLE